MRSAPLRTAPLQAGLALAALALACSPRSPGGATDEPDASAPEAPAAALLPPQDMDHARPVEVGPLRIDPERGLVNRGPGASPGYTLFAPLRSTKTFLVDLDGRVRHVWDSAFAPGNAVYLLDDGRLLKCCRVENPAFEDTGGRGGRIEERTWEGELTWELDWSSPDTLQHHDVEPLPNGNVLLLVWERRTREEAIAAGNPPELVEPGGLMPDVVVEVEPTRPSGGRVVWRWDAWDHLVQDLDPALPDHGSIPERLERIDVIGDYREERALTLEEQAELREQEAQLRAVGYLGGEDEAAGDDEPGRRRPRGVDWLHSNSIDYLEQHDLIAISVRRFHEVWVIDHSTTIEEAAGSSGGDRGRGGDLLWRWGNPRAFGLGTRDDQRLFGQHDATWVTGATGDELRLLVFNNGTGRPDGAWSSVDELVLPFHPERGFERAPGEPFGPAEPVWSYAAPERESFHSFAISGAQRLPNGNTLICSGMEGRLFEVTPAGEVVWDYLNPYGGEVRLGAGPATGGPRQGMIPKGVFRALRYPPEHPAFAGRELPVLDPAEE